MNPAHPEELTLLETVWYIATNIIIFGQDITSNLSPEFHNAYNHPVSPAWTLASELVFYITISFLPLRKNARIACLILLGLFSLYIRFYVWDTNRYPISTFVFFSTGALSYYLYERLKIIKISSVVGYIFFIIVAAFMVSGYTIGKPERIFHLYVLLVFLMPCIFYSSRFSKIDRFIGDLSYPIYISHMVVITHASWFYAFTGNAQINIGINVILVSIVLYLLVEKTIDKYRAVLKRS